MERSLQVTAGYDCAGCGSEMLMRHPFSEVTLFGCWTALAPLNLGVFLGQDEQKGTLPPRVSLQPNALHCNH